MKLIFAGTPDFAVPALSHLIHSKHEIIAVLTQPDRPAGRGKKLQASPVKLLAQDHDLTLWQPESLKEKDIQAQIINLNADAIIVVAYGLMIPSPLLRTTPLGCINIHPSLLPKWRGPTPIQTSLLNGDTVTGVTIMQLDEGMDTGPILSQHQYTIPKQSNSQQLHDTLSELGAQQLITTLENFSNGKLTPQPQQHQAATTTKKIQKADGQINWHQNANQIHHQIRAYNPWPICFTDINQQRLRIFEAEIIDQTTSASPGTVIDFTADGLNIACQTGVLRVTRVQLPGAKQSTIKDFYNAQKKRILIGNTICK